MINQDTGKCNCNYFYYGDDCSQIMIPIIIGNFMNCNGGRYCPPVYCVSVRSGLCPEGLECSVCTSNQGCQALKNDMLLKLYPIVNKRQEKIRSFQSRLFKFTIRYSFHCTCYDRVRQFAWAYFTKNFNQINETFKNSPLFGRIIGSCLTSKMDDSQYNEVVNFFKDHPVPIADRSIKQDLEMVIIDSNWFKAFNQDLSNWVQSK
ncbi:hypothetical protein ACTFIW_009661 [Dictyostelium discoideum]